MGLLLAITLQEHCLSWPAPALFVGATLFGIGVIITVSVTLCVRGARVLHAGESPCARPVDPIRTSRSTLLAWYCSCWRRRSSAPGQHAGGRRGEPMSGPFETLATVDRLIHEPARFAILTALAECRRADFVYLQSLIGISTATCPAFDKTPRRGLIDIEKTTRGQMHGR